MTSDFKLEVGISDYCEVPELNFVNDKTTTDGRTNSVYKILRGIRKQGSKSFGYFLTKVERRAMGERYKINSPFLCLFCFLTLHAAGTSRAHLCYTLGISYNWDNLKLATLVFQSSSFGENKLLVSGSITVDLDVDEKREHGSWRKSGALLSGTAYCFSSCGMILLNKVILSTYNFNAALSLMFYQNLVSCLVVAILGFSGAVSVEKLNWKLTSVWLPVNIIFIGMLASSIYSLKYINIAMVTILKNVTNILTAIGELYIFGRHQTQKVWTAMFLMIISTISGGITDLSFDGTGYVWQSVNCILTASYTLTLRRVMDKAKQCTRNGSLNEISMVLLNNLLSLPFALILILLFDEWEYVINVDVIRLPMFWVVATASGLLGLSISFTSIWFLHQTGPTTYSLVGSLNKIPISIAGLVLFKVPLSLPNLFSILFGLFAGIFFARAKMS